MLVDEFTYGESGERYHFDSDSPYKNLHMLFSLDVPAGTTDLTGLPCSIEHLVAAQQGGG